MSTSLQRYAREAHEQSVTRHRKASFTKSLLAFSSITLLAIITLSGVYMLRTETGARFNPHAILWFMPVLVVLWAALFLEVRQRPYSLHLMHLIAVYVLLAAAPMYQVAIGAFPLQRYARPIEAHVLAANISVLLWLTGYLFAYAIVTFVHRTFPDRAGNSRLSAEVSSSRIWVGLLLAIPVFAYLWSQGLAGVVTRKGASEAFSDLGASSLVLVNKVFVRAVPIVGLAAGLLLVRKLGALRAPGATFLTGLVLIGVPFFANPNASGRYWLVAVLIAFLAPHLLRNRDTAVALLGGSLVGLSILPSLGAARHAFTASELVEELQIQHLPSPMLYLATSGDVGAYGMLNLAVRWIEQFGHTWGKQTMSAFLFWVPRSMWPDKAIATGSQITEDFGFDFTVISAPIVAEPLIDFGFIAVPLYGAIFGLLLAHLDAVYWSRRDFRIVRAIDIFYPFQLGMMLLLTRGNLMSAIAYASGWFVASLPIIASASLVRRRRVRGGGV